MIGKFLALAIAASAAVVLPSPVEAAVPTPAVCKTFAANVIRWNKEARTVGCKLPTNAGNMHFREGDIYKWCLARPNEDRSPEALGHREILFKACPRYRKAS